MTRRLSWSVVLGASFAMLLTGALVGLGRAAAEEPFLIERDTIDIDPSAGVRLHGIVVDNRLGDVSVVGHDEPGVSLTVVKRAPDGETLDRLKVNLVPDPAGVLLVSAAVLFGRDARPVPAGVVRIDLTLAVPRQVHADIRAWNGRLAVSGLRGGARLVAHEADLRVDDLEGRVETISTRGEQRLAAIDGDLTASLVRGTMWLDEITGASLAASVHDGAVTARRISAKRVQIRTTFGRIDFEGELLAGGRAELRSYKGDVQVRLGGRTLALIDATAPRLESRLALADEVRAGGRLGGRLGSGTGAQPAGLLVSSACGLVSLGLIND